MADDAFSPGDVIGQFRDAMLAAGIRAPDRIEADGELHRFRGEGDKPGTVPCWYVLRLDGRLAGRPAGGFGSWRLGISEKWCAKGGKPLSPAERVRLAAESAEAKHKAACRTAAAHDAAASRAACRWDKSEPADPAHPYLLAKAVRPHGLRQDGDLLLVPLRDFDGRLWTLQTIRPDGDKRFLKGSRPLGLFCLFGDLAAPEYLVICEGWATGATLYEKGASTVLAAMNTGNLKPVAIAARERWPALTLVIAADNDRFTVLPDGRRNPGVICATAAAKASDALVAVPDFPDGSTGTDFNDLHHPLRQAGHAAPGASA